MKVIIVFLLILCVSCGTAAGQSSPAPTPSPAPAATAAPTATPAPDYRPCLTVLAYLAIHHDHPVFSERDTENLIGTDGAEIARAGDPEVPNLLRPFTTGLFVEQETPASLIADFCDGVIDTDVLSAISQKRDKR